MRLANTFMAMLLATASIGIAHANLIQNGDFSDTGGISTPTQFGTGSKNHFTATQFIHGWTGNDGYEIWYSNAADAGSINATSEWGRGSTSNTHKEKLYDTITAPPSTTSFVGLDGSQKAGSQSSISQQLTGLNIGSLYNVSFDWGGSQFQSRSGDTTEYLQVSFGNDSQNTQTLNNASGGFTGWYSETLQFVAHSTSAALEFLSVGTPTGLPPVAVLTNVSVTDPPAQVVTHEVPEPSSLLLFACGLLGIGLVSRRRSGRSRNDKR